MKTVRLDDTIASPIMPGIASKSIADVQLAAPDPAPPENCNAKRG